MAAASNPSILRKVLSGLPRPIKGLLAYAYRGAQDGVDVVLARRPGLVPPRRLSFVGSGDYVKTGDEFLRYFVEFGRLQPEHRVLDVGCGIGRMARPLTRYLTSGTYAGVDVVPRGIAWCQSHITRSFPNFTFQLADVYNKEYNPAGKCQPAHYRFPFEDESFDFAFLTSVFTHLLPDGTRRYLTEVARCLRPGGFCLATFFLLNKDSRKLLQAGRGSISFDFPSGDGCWIHDVDIPEEAVSYDEAEINDRYEEVGLLLRDRKYGSWCGRAEYVTYQDIVIAEKSTLESKGSGRRC